VRSVLLQWAGLKGLSDTLLVFNCIAECSELYRVPQIRMSHQSQCNFCTTIRECASKISGFIYELAIIAAIQLDYIHFKTEKVLDIRISIQNQADFLCQLIELIKHYSFSVTILAQFSTCAICS